MSDHLWYMYGMVWYGTVWYAMVWNGTVPYCMYVPTCAHIRLLLTKFKGHGEDSHQ